MISSGGSLFCPGVIKEKKCQKKIGNNILMLEPNPCKILNGSGNLKFIYLL
jgi:hypothetical protein